MDKEEVIERCAEYGKEQSDDEIRSDQTFNASVKGHQS